MRMYKVIDSGTAEKFELELNLASRDRWILHSVDGLTAIMTRDERCDFVSERFGGHQCVRDKGHPPKHVLWVEADK